MRIAAIGIDAITQMNPTSTGRDKRQDGMSFGSVHPGRSSKRLVTGTFRTRAMSSIVGMAFLSRGT